MTSNKTALSPHHEYRSKGSNGYFREGFVHYINGNTSLSDAQAQLQSLQSAGWFTDRLSLACFEVMFYNYYLSYGIVYQIELYASYSGIVYAEQTRNFFMTETYNFSLSRSQAKFFFALTWMIFLLIIGLTYFLNFMNNLFALIKVGRNDFRVNDVVHVMQFCMGIVVTCVYFYLYFGKKHHWTFKIPFSTEDEF